ncbi:MAG: hypothetical protein IPM74_03300 [Crocinitomicaceae bacterium]|nr:hypothetical protein [Crocinitomicaceae bacterium]MBK8924942.1 hypothetical protein [Crocinitomicaceae bacterium]
MERELRIVVIVFLTYLIFGLTTYFQSGSLIAPLILTKPILLILAMIFLVLNFSQRNKWLLIFYLFALTAYAITDEFILSWIERDVSSAFAEISRSTFFSWLTFLVFFVFLIISVFYQYKILQKPFIFFLELILILACFCFLFTSLSLVQEIFIKGFFILYIIASNLDAGLNDKILRVMSYQYLCLVLLESFEYFI